jgi:hypothetical protein
MQETIHSGIILLIINPQVHSIAYIGKNLIPNQGNCFFIDSCFCFFGGKKKKLLIPYDKILRLKRKKKILVEITTAEKSVRV